MLWLTTIFCTLLLQTVLGQTDVTSHDHLPPLQSFHNYDDCLARPEPFTYCMLFAEVQPNYQSNLWQSIESISNDSFHRFRHDRLFIGLCLEQCREILTSSPHPETDGKIPEGSTAMENEITDYYRRIYAADSSNDRRLVQHDLLDKCANYEFQQKYNLSLSTFVEYCNGGASESQTDYLHVIAYVLIAALLFLNIFCSAYDYILKCLEISPNSKSDDYYNQALKSPGSTILTSFSVWRNFKTVTALSKSDLQFTYFFRVFAMSVVIIGHTLMCITVAPMENPEFFENFLYRTEVIIFQNASFVIQIFFVLTGFLLKLKFDQLQLITKKSSWTTCVSVFLSGCLNRYLRIIPSMAVLILFNATIFVRLTDGPFWRHFAEGERAFCREYWWKNILMINNFMMEDSCAHQTWYLAADMQLMAFYLMILILTTRFMWTKRPIYMLMGLLAFVIPGALTYIHRLNYSHLLVPEFYRYLYFKDSPEFSITYTPFYCNFGGYLVGIICAEIYTKSERFQHIKAAWGKYTEVLKVQIPLVIFELIFGFGLLFTGLLVLNKDWERPSFWFALYAACYRNLWAMFGGFATLVMLLKFGWIAYKMACSATARVLGRITFQIFLWHVTILKIIYGSYRQPLEISALSVGYHIILTLVVSAVVGLLMTIMVEYPIGHVISYLLKQGPKEIPTMSTPTSSKNHTTKKPMNLEQRNGKIKEN